MSLLACTTVNPIILLIKIARNKRLKIESTLRVQTSANLI